MWWSSSFILILSSVCCFTLFSCGYRFAATAPIALPQGISKLYLQEVKNPTTQSWLQPRLRTEVREEFTRRGQVSWVDKDKAEGILRIEITRFSSATKLENAQEQTVRSEVVLGLKAEINRADDGSKVWSSGSQTARWSFTGPEDGPESREAEERVVELAAEKLINTLSQGF